ncbi:MAG: rhodanese-like domain-containing protein [Planctomycetia bacterium]|jgi:rhodanese-related sulfurtransferase
MSEADAHQRSGSVPQTVPLEVSVSAAARLLRDAVAARGGTLLLDCRTPEEHATARIEGSMLVPMQELSGRLAELDAFRQATVVVHCHHGMRSLKVARWLREQGFPRAVSMQGGIDAWSVEIDPAVPRY